MSKNIRSFAEIKKEDIGSAGGKGANLGEMTGAGINIPGGGVLLAGAYDEYLGFNGIEPEKFEDAEGLREAIRQGKIPEDLSKEIGNFYFSIGGDDVRLAVRSSATAEDLDDASFAGSRRLILM